MNLHRTALLRRRAHAVRRRASAVHRRARGGFTLIELVVVIALVSILSMMGMMMSDEMIPRYRTRKAAMTFQSLAQQCRALAVRTGRECSIWLLTSDSALTDLTSNDGEYWVGLGDLARNSTTWDYLPVNHGTSDLDTSQGQVDLSDTSSPYYARRVSIADWGSSISGPGSGNSDRIVFGPRGFVTNPPSDFDSDGYIAITFVNKVVRADGRTQDYIARVTRSGMVRVDPSANDTLDGLSSGTAQGSTAP